MRRTTSNTQQRMPSNRPVRRTPSTSGIQRRPLTRPSSSRTNSMKDLSYRRDLEDNESDINENDHDRYVLETLNNILEVVKEGVESISNEKSEIMSSIKSIRDNIDIIKTHTPRKDPEYEAESRDLLIDLRDELRGLRKEHINVFTDLKESINASELSIPLHRRNSYNKSSTDVVNAIRDLKTVIETPRGSLQDGDYTPRGSIDGEYTPRGIIQDSIREQISEYTSSISNIVSKLDEIISINKESKEAYHARKSQDIILLTGIKESLEKKIDFTLSTDGYEKKYQDMRNVHQTQFYKFSKILAMYHNAMLTLCRSDNPEAEEEFRKLQELVGAITEDSEVIE